MSSTYLQERARLNHYLTMVKRAETDEDYLKAAYILLLSFSCFENRLELQNDIHTYIKSVKRRSSSTEWKQGDIEDTIRQIKSGAI